MTDTTAVTNTADPAKGRARSVLRAFVLGIGSALLYGAWALHANWSTDRALRAGLAQASLSFLSTMTFALVTETLFRLGRTPQRGFTLAASGTALLIATLTTTVHVIVGTPRILVTAAPSIVFGSIFFTSYAWGLRHADSRASSSER